MAIEASWFHYTTKGNSQQAGRLIEMMEELYQFMDSGEWDGAVGF